jgi:glucosamine-6-phosphate deaminase
VFVFPDAEALGAQLAGEILDLLSEARKESRSFLLGCPGGRSLRSTYQALGRLATESGADLSPLVIVMMDEYVLPTRQGGFRNCPANAHYSCHRFAREEIAATLNSGLPRARRVRSASVWFPNPDAPGAYETKIEKAGGVDLFLIASGASDGHVAFNPPGSALNSPTRIVPLAESTRRDNLGTFPKFGGLADVPAHGVSVGLGTIARHSRRVALVIHGAHKREAVRRLLQCPDFTPDWPASVILRCRKPSVWLDHAAAGELALESVTVRWITNN